MSTLLEKLINQKVWSTADMLTLLKLGEDPNTTNSEGESLIHLLVNYDKDGIKPHNKEAIAILVNHYQVDLNALNNKGDTALQTIINKKRWMTQDAMKLVALGANPDTKNSNGETLIHLLVNYHPDGIKFHNTQAIANLVNRYKANINSVNKQGYTALQTIINKPRWLTQDAMSLVALGADANTTNMAGESLIHLLSNYDKDGIKPHNYQAITTLVKDYKADINVKNSIGITALQCLINKQNFNTADMLLFLNLNADPNTKNSKGDSILHLLAVSKKNNSSIIRTLVQSFKANLNSKNSEDHSALRVSLDTISLHGNTANAYELIKLSKDKFKNKLIKAVTGNEDTLSNLTTWFNSAFKANDKTSYTLQGEIRHMALEVLKETLVNLNPNEKKEKLEWARKQPLFCAHRSHNFLARLGRTNTISIIDSMLKEIKPTSSPTARV